MKQAKQQVIHIEQYVATLKTNVSLNTIGWIKYIMVGDITLSAGPFQVVLDSCYFNPVGSLGLEGYTSAIDPDQFSTVEYGIRAGSIVDGYNFDTMRRTFSMDLLIPFDIVQQLELVFTYQRRQIATKQSDTSIRMIDERKPIVEPSPATRARIGTLLNAPVGAVKYYPLYDVLCTSYNKTLFIPKVGSELENVTIQLKELDTVPLTENIT